MFVYTIDDIFGLALLVITILVISLAFVIDKVTAYFNGKNKQIEAKQKQMNLENELKAKRSVDFWKTINE